MTPDFPHQYWHCMVQLSEDCYSVVNDLTYDALRTKIVDPWLQKRRFTVNGLVVDPKKHTVERIQISRTKEDSRYFANRHNAEMSRNGIADMVTDRSLLAVDAGEDYTDALLFTDGQADLPAATQEMIIQLCRRLPMAARILECRSRKDKKPFLIEDEYDVQDYLHSLLRGYLKYSIQEDPIGKIEATTSSKVDISIEDLGVLIELKYARVPGDQKGLFDDLSKDMILYTKWAPLQRLIFVIYNSRVLRDPEAFEKLSGHHEFHGKRYELTVVLA